jgi:hypothetical protein
MYRLEYEDKIELIQSLADALDLFTELDAFDKNVKLRAVNYKDKNEVLITSTHYIVTGDGRLHLKTDRGPYNNKNLITGYLGYPMFTLSTFTITYHDRGYYAEASFPAGLLSFNYNSSTMTGASSVFTEIKKAQKMLDTSTKPELDDMPF